MAKLRLILDRYIPPEGHFRVLHRIFLLRVVDLELLSADADTARLLGQFGSMFASISFIFTVPLILVGGGLPQSACWTVEHFFLATTMAVVGFFGVLSWESIFPDRRDLLIMGPLPVRTATLFFAKLAALAAALGLAALSLNCFTGIFWPFLFSASGLLGAPRSIFAYWITIAAASVFIFCAVLGLHGITSLLLPRQYFLRISAWLQTGGVCLLLGDYILEPSLESTAALTAPQNQRLLAALPSYWFLGLFEQLNGSMQPAFAPLARRAWWALAIALSGALLSVLVAYFGTLRRIVEEPDILPGSRRTKRSFTLGGPLNSAVTAFSVRTLLRSRQHRVIFAFYIGIGLTVVLLLLIRLPSHGPASAAVVPFFSASYLMMVFAVLGARVVFALPIAVGANWTFRMTERENPALYLAAVRNSLLVITVVPVCGAFALSSAFLCIHGWPICFAVFHIAALALLGMAMVDVSLRGFYKIPFTASYLPGKANVHLFFWVALMLLIPLANYAAGQEESALYSVARSSAMIAGLALIVGGMRWILAVAARGQPGLRFEESYAEEIISLRISA